MKLRWVVIVLHQHQSAAAIPLAEQPDQVDSVLAIPRQAHPTGVLPQAEAEPADRVASMAQAASTTAAGVPIKAVAVADREEPEMQRL